MDRSQAAHVFYAEQLLRQIANDPQRMAGFMIAAAALTAHLRMPEEGERVGYPEMKASFLTAADSLAHSLRSA